MRGAMLLILWVPCFVWAFSVPSAGVAQIINRAYRACNNHQCEKGLSWLQQTKSYTGVDRAWLMRAQGELLLQRQQLKVAKTMLQQALNSKIFSGDEAARIWQSLGVLQYNEGEFDDATRAFKNGLSEAQGDGLKKQLGIGLASSYCRNQNPAACLATLQPLKGSGNETHLQQLELVALSQLHRYKEALHVAEQLLAHENRDPLVWRQTIALALLSQQQSKALVLQQLAFQKGIFESSLDYERLAQTLVNEGLPNAGAEILLRGLQSKQIKDTPERRRVLVQYATQARDWSLAASQMKRLAAKTRKSDDYWIEASLWLRAGHFQAERTALRCGLAQAQRADRYFGRFAIRLAEQELAADNVKQAQYYSALAIKDPDTTHRAKRLNVGLQQLTASMK